MVRAAKRRVASDRKREAVLIAAVTASAPDCDKHLRLLPLELLCRSSASSIRWIFTSLAYTSPALPLMPSGDDLLKPFVTMAEQQRAKASNHVEVTVSIDILEEQSVAPLEDNGWRPLALRYCALRPPVCECGAVNPSEALGVCWFSCRVVHAHTRLRPVFFASYKRWSQRSTVRWHWVFIGELRGANAMVARISSC